MPCTTSIYDNLGPAHVLIFGASFGSQLYQSFISGPISYSALPRQQFSQLQARTFPIYFTLQTLSAPLLLLTLPRGPQDSLIALCTPSAGNAGFQTTVVPILVAFVTSAANLLVVGPRVTRVMEERRVVLEELAGGEGAKEEGGERLLTLNRAFGRAHGVSTVLNLVGVVAIGVVGWGVGRRFK